MTEHYHPVTKEHCNHECVCHWHVEGKIPIGKNGLCRKTDCIYDSRSRPLPAELEKFAHIMPERRDCLHCLAPDCPIWQAADQNCWKSLEEHDAEIRRQERENTALLYDAVGMDFKIIGVEHISTHGGKNLHIIGKYEIVVKSLRGEP